MSNLRFLWIGMRKDAGIVRRDPSALLIPIGIPLVLGLLMNMVFGHSGQATPQGRLLVADEDKSIASGMLTGVFARDPLSKMVSVRHVSRSEGRSSIDRGEASAFLIIPKGLQDSLFTRRPERIELYTNPSESIIPNVIRESVSMYIDGASYMQRGGAAQSNPYLRSPLIQLESTVVADTRPKFNFAALFFPCMIFMSLMMLANSLAAEIWKEHQAGTLRRLAATPVPLTWYLAGRVLFAAFVLLCVAAVAVAAIHWMAGVPVMSFPAAILWTVFSGVALYLCLLYLVMGAQSARSANILGNMVIFPLAMLGGCFFPFEAMPDWMARIGKMTPNGWAILEFRSILDGSGHAASLAAATAALLAVSVIAFALAARRLRGSFIL